MMKETIKSIFFIIIVLAIMLIPKITNAVITADEIDNDFISIKNDPINYVKDDQFLVKDNNDEGMIVIHLGEKNEINDETYESIVNIIEALLGNDAILYFKTICPNLNQDIRADGITIEINPEKTNSEKGLFSNPKFEDRYQYKCLVRVTIDTSKVNDAVNKYMSKDNNTATNNIKETNVVASNITSMPRTGEEQNSDLFIAYMLIVLAIIGIITLIITRKNK